MLRLTNVLILAIIGAVSMVAMGCTTHHQRPASHAELAAAKRIVLSNDQAIAIHGARYEPNNTVMAMDSGHESRFQLSDIKEVETVDHGLGMIQGIGGGLLVGAGIGALLGFAAGDDPPCPRGLDGLLCVQFSAESKAVSIGVVMAVVAAIPGAIIGGIKGSSNVYHYRPSKVAVDLKPTDGGGQLSLRYRF